jgi:integrase
MNEPNIRRRGSTYEIAVSAGTDPATGRRRRIVRTARTLKAARAERDRLLVQIRDGIAADPGSATVAGYLLERWLPHMRHRVRPRTLTRYAELLEHHVVPVVGSYKLRQLRPAHVQAVIDSMLAAGLAPRTAHHAYRVLSNALRDAVDWQIVPANVAAAVAAPRVERPRLVVPDAEQVGQIVRAAADRPPYHVPIAIAATTGLRLGEVFGLRWSAIDLEAGTLRVVASLQLEAGKLVSVEPKTDRARRTVALPTATVALLKRHRANQSRRRLLLGEAWQGTDLVCERGDGHPIHPSTLSWHFRQAATAAGITGTRFHDLRHAYATLLLSANEHPKVVSDLVGHSSAAFTMDTYQHLLPTMGQAAAAAIEAALGDHLEGAR